MDYHGGHFLKAFQLLKGRCYLMNFCNRKQCGSQCSTSTDRTALRSIESVVTPVFVTHIVLKVNIQMDEQIQKNRTLDDIPLKTIRLLTAKTLKILGISLETTLGTIYALNSDKVLLAQFLIWAYDNKPNEEQIMHWIVEHT